MAGLPFLGRYSKRVWPGMPDETFGGRLFPDAPKCQRLKHGVVLTDKHDPASRKDFLVQGVKNTVQHLLTSRIR